MSFKDDVEFVKEELSSDEKVLESVFKLETLYKKHKKKLFGVLIITVLGMAGVVTTNIIKDSNLNSSNNALLTLQKDNSNRDAEMILKSKNKELYALYQYSKAVKSGDIKLLTELSHSKNEILSDLSKYHINMFKNISGNSKYYKNLSVIGEAFVMIKDNKKRVARDKLTLVEPNSDLYKLSVLMKHQTVEIKKWKNP